MGISTPDFYSLNIDKSTDSASLETNINVNGALNFTSGIVDLNGRIIQTTSTKTSVGENKIQLDVTSMNNGVYNLILQSNDELTAKRFIKM